ncbi:hypothetical protein BHM03_00062812 [Ensete ventricosum]|nr:hypothetical protein BHM03_00062812 [Ensete ventricosum]
MDSKLGGYHYRESASLELYRGSLLIAAQRLQKYSSIDDKKWRITWLFIDLLTPTPNMTPNQLLKQLILQL